LLHGRSPVDLVSVNALKTPELRPCYVREAAHARIGDRRSRAPHRLISAKRPAQRPAAQPPRAVVRRPAKRPDEKGLAGFQGWQ